MSKNFYCISCIVNRQELVRVETSFTGKKDWCPSCLHLRENVTLQLAADAYLEILFKQKTEIEEKISALTKAIRKERRAK